MEKAKISPSQFFSLIVMFELGSAIVVGLGMTAKQDAWLTILLGMLSGMLLFYAAYGYLWNQFPYHSLTGIIQKVVGRFLGIPLSILYVFYFCYISSRVLRDFGELLITSILTDTPLLVVNFIMILIIAYASYLGIEVLGRTGEIYFAIMMGFVFLGLFSIFTSGVFHIENLLPMLEQGWSPVLKSTFPVTFTFPFGEMIVFTMFFPYLNKAKAAIKVGLTAILFSGLILSLTIATNIGVIGVHEAANAAFPLLKTAERINIGDFLQRLDAIVIVVLIIGGFFKSVLFFYAAIIGAAEICAVQNYRKLVLPAAILTLILSVFMASNFIEHIETGLQKVPYLLHLPMQVGVPLLLVGLTWIRKQI